MDFRSTGTVRRKVFAKVFATLSGRGKHLGQTQADMNQ
jgi:hypothetical protein